jgi:hypothetical protein
MFIGSCFSENISQHLSRFHFQINNGAHGIIFHPLAIFKALNHLMEAKVYQHADLTKAAHGWVSLSHHGSYTHADQQELLSRIQNDLDGSHDFLKSTKVLVLTFGSAMGYKSKSTHEVVANCHRLPQQEFERSLSTSDELEKSASKTLSALKDAFPQIEVILTVSPVRHLREGTVENQRSKSRLILLCERLEKEFSFVRYFPAYELVMDDLRDYRFYAEDMIHPNGSAISYIAEKFEQFLLSTKAKEACQAVLPHVLRKEHRSVNESKEAEAKRKAESDAQIRLVLENIYKS